MPSVKEYLDTGIQEHLSGLVQEKRLEKVKEEAYREEASVDYKSENILIRIVSEYGGIRIEIAPTKDKDKFFAVDMIAELLSPDLYKGKPGLVRLSLADQVNLLRKNWDQFQVLYSPETYGAETKKRLKDLDEKRTSKVLPKTWK